MQLTYILTCYRRKVAAAASVFNNLTPETTPSHRDTTQATETARRHALEKMAMELDKVQALEKRLGVIKRWEPGTSEWQQARKKVTLRRYRRCVDRLEGLVVARMFELSKMNQSNTGTSTSPV